MKVNFYFFIGEVVIKFYKIKNLFIAKDFVYKNFVYRRSEQTQLLLKSNKYQPHPGKKWHVTRNTYSIKLSIG